MSFDDKFAPFFCFVISVPCYLEDFLMTLFNSSKTWVSFNLELNLFFHNIKMIIEYYFFFVDDNELMKRIKEKKSQFFRFNI